MVPEWETIRTFSPALQARQHFRDRKISLHTRDKLFVAFTAGERHVIEFDKIDNFRVGIHVASGKFAGISFDDLLALLDGDILPRRLQRQRCRVESAA